MIGNDRLYSAVVALATAERDARAKLCLAIAIIEPLRVNESTGRMDLWERLEKLKKETKNKGPQIINGKVLKDAYQYSASTRHNKTYRKYAKEIPDVWLKTLN